MLHFPQIPYQMEAGHEKENVLIEENNNVIM